MTVLLIEEQTMVIGAADLNIDLANKAEEALFKWLIASFLMGKRIRGDVAAQAYRIIVEKHHRDTPGKLAACTHGQLVRMLGEGRYTRYDESTANRLLKLSERLTRDYGGKVLNILEASKDRSEFEARLKEFEGIGPKTVEIFMRDAQQVLF
jgi:endonuclease III